MVPVMVEGGQIKKLYYTLVKYCNLIGRLKGL